jgi:predicted Fe-Mo cluster-binding NifX family protein
MKIAVTATGNTLDAQVDPRFGRAPKFILYDSDSDTFEAVDNTQNLNAVQGAGIQSAETVSRNGAECVITGHCGPKAFRTLGAAGVKVYVNAQGTVAEAIRAFKAGELTLASGPDVEGHWE